MTWQPEWYLPIAILVLGSMTGLTLITLRGRGETPDVKEDGRRTDLLETKEVVLEALRGLETERHKLEPTEYDKERQALIDRGAGALANLDDAAPDTEEGPVAAPTKPLISQQWQGALWMLAAVIIAWALWNTAGDTTRARVGDEPITGVQMSNSPYVQKMNELNKRLEEKPNDVATLNELTSLALSAGDMVMAQQTSQTVERVDPTNIQGRINKAILASLVGLHDRALEYLDEILQEQPDQLDAMTYKGLISIEAGRYDEAIASLENVIKVRGPHPALIAALERARAGGAPRGPAAPPEQRSATPTGDGKPVASGSISLAPESQDKLEQAQALFISVRDPAGGPPLAARKLAGEVPAEFSITTADAISMGAARPFPARVSLQIRLDNDGNAMTKDGEPSFSSEVDLGATDLQVILK
jgi:tetratricopeptide (TPR) repeat protein